VVGSNIFNIAVILGLASIIHPLKTQIKLIKIDTPLMIAATILFIIIFWDAHISRIEGGLLFLLILLFSLSSFYFAKREKVDAEILAEESAAPKPFKSVYLEIAVILISLLFLVFGSNNLVSGAIRVAKKLGVSQAIIGLTIVAAGTSLPELATSVIAAMRKSPDIALGNVVGSNIFNILGILGLASIISPIHAPDIQRFDVYVMLFFSLLLLPLMWTKFKLQRWEGIFLFAGYVAYIFIVLM
jgi:cation:H+ antiporter